MQIQDKLLDFIPLQQRAFTLLTTEFQCTLADYQQTPIKENLASVRNRGQEITFIINTRGGKILNSVGPAYANIKSPINKLDKHDTLAGIKL